MKRRAIILVGLIFLMVACNQTGSPDQDEPPKFSDTIEKYVESPEQPEPQASMEEADPPSGAQGSEANPQTDQEIDSYIKYPEDIVIVTEEDIAVIPDDAVKVLSTYMGGLGGGGGAECEFLAPTNGFTGPVFLPAESVVDRITNLFVKSCGWDVGEEIITLIEKPSGEIIEETIVVDEWGVSARYDLQLSDPLGEYRFIFEGESGRIEHSIELKLPEEPTVFFDYKTVVLVGFANGEEINFSFYGADFMDVLEQPIIGFVTLNANDEGQLLVEFNFDTEDMVFYLEGESSGKKNPYDRGSGKGFSRSPFWNVHPQGDPTEKCKFSVKFIEDVTIPDGTVVERNKTFTKVWRVKNTGNCDWTTGEVYLSFHKGDSLGDEQSIRLPAELYPIEAGEMVDISVDFTAPNESGTFWGQWNLYHARLINPLKLIWVEIVVP